MQDKQETNNNKLVNNNKLQDKIAILSKEKEEGEIIKNPPVTVVNIQTNASNLKRVEHQKDITGQELQLFFTENETYIILCLQKNYELKILPEFKNYLENKYKSQFLKHLKENSIEKILILPPNIPKKETPILDEFAKFSNIPLKKKKPLDTSLLNYLKAKTNNYLENFTSITPYTYPPQYITQPQSYIPKQEIYPQSQPPKAPPSFPPYESYPPQIQINPYYAQQGVGVPSYPPQGYNQYMYQQQQQPQMPPSQLQGIPGNVAYGSGYGNNPMNRLVPPQHGGYQSGYYGKEEGYEKKRFGRRKGSSESGSREEYVGIKKKIRKDYGEREKKERRYRDRDERRYDGYREKERRYDKYERKEFRGEKKDDYSRD